MGFYASDHPDVPGMQGLHLFHFMLSNCSQRAMARPAFGRAVASSSFLNRASELRVLPGAPESAYGASA